MISVTRTGFYIVVDRVGLSSIAAAAHFLIIHKRGCYDSVSNGIAMLQASPLQSRLGKSSNQVLLVFILFLLNLIVRLHLVPLTDWESIP